MNPNFQKISDEQLVHPQEKRLFIVSLLISLIIWGILIVATIGIGLIFLIIGVLAAFIFKQLFIARIKGFGIKISENQYPLIFNEVKRISNEMNLEDIPSVYVYEMSGILNAFATHILSRNFVILTTEILDACGDDQELLSFIIAHEITHLVRNHTRRQGFLLPSKLIPWLGNAYSRACEYTCDAFATKYGTTTLEKAKQAITILATASRTRSLSLHEQSYLNQARDVTHFWPAVVNTNSPHPFTSLRYARISSLASDGRGIIPKSNLVGVLLAPLFSARTLITIYIVMIFAIFLPQLFQPLQKLPEDILQDNRALSQVIEEVVRATKESTTFPHEIDENLTWFDVTAEPNAIRYHYILKGEIDYDETKSSLVSEFCGDNYVRSLMEQNIDIDMELVYYDEKGEEKYFMVITASDCLK